MARSISVKINTADVISMIEDKVSEYEAKIASYPADLAQYEIDRREWNSKVATRVSELLSTDKHFDAENSRDQIIVGKHWNNVNIQIGDNLIADLKDTMPERPSDPNSGYGSLASKVDELNKTLKLLRLTPQETVTSSTYNSVLELL